MLHTRVKPLTVQISRSRSFDSASAATPDPQQQQQQQQQEVIDTARTATTNTTNTTNNTMGLLKDGFILVVRDDASTAAASAETNDNKKEGEEDEVVLLRSTERLLTTLGYAIPSTRTAEPASFPLRENGLPHLLLDPSTTTTTTTEEKDNEEPDTAAVVEEKETENEDNKNAAAEEEEAKGNDNDNDENKTDSGEKETEYEDNKNAAEEEEAKGNDNDEDKTDSGSPDGKTEEDADAATGKEEDEASNKEEKGKKNKKKDKKKNEIPEKNMPYQKLKRIENVGDIVFKALDDIKALKQARPPQPPQEDGDNTKKNKRRERVSYQVMKNQALEKQRAKLQKHLSSNEEGEGSPATADDDDGAGAEEDHPNDEVVDVDDDTRTERDGWILAARGLNSIKILTPVLIPIFNHKRHNDSSLVIGKSRLKTKNKGNKHQCWFLGEVVFDVVAERTFNRFSEALEDIFSFIGVPKEELTLESTVWRDRLDRMMDEVASRLQQSLNDESTAAAGAAITPSWIGQLPFDTLPETADRTAAVERANKLDAKFSLVIKDRDEDEHNRYLKSIEKLRERVENVIQQRYPGARISVYGSCLSDLSLGKNADVDLSLHIKEAAESRSKFEAGDIDARKYQNTLRDIVYQVRNRLMRLRHEFRGVEAIARARVPVVKGIYSKADNPHSDDGSLHFDICLLNDIAVSNSSLLREYSLVDPRTRSLMFAVKRWASENGINSAQDSYLSSYTWMNLVIFYLQCVGLVPNLQNAELMQKVGFSSDPDNESHHVNNLNTAFLKWEQVQDAWKMSDSLSSISVAELLYGFFHFYTYDFSYVLYMVSIKRGTDTILPKTMFRRCNMFLCIEDPFETYDSHCPHNLAWPANTDIAIREISECIRGAEVYLENILVGSDDVDSSVERLWPEPTSTKKNANQQQRGGGRGRNNRNQKQQQNKENHGKKGGRNKKGAAAGEAKDGSSTGGKAKAAPAGEAPQKKESAGDGAKEKSGKEDGADGKDEVDASEANGGRGGGGRGGKGGKGRRGPRRGRGGKGRGRGGDDGTKNNLDGTSEAKTHEEGKKDSAGGADAAKGEGGEDQNQKGKQGRGGAGRGHGGRGRGRGGRRYRGHGKNKKKEDGGGGGDNKGAPAPSYAGGAI